MNLVFAESENPVLISSSDLYVTIYMYIIYIMKNEDDENLAFLNHKPKRLNDETHFQR